MRHGTAPRTAARLITALIVFTTTAILITPPQAHADNARTAQASMDNNIEISVPTTVPCLVKADGTIIAPTAETWKIRNDSPQPVTLDTVAAETITLGTSITAKSQPTTLYEDDTQGGKGSYTIAINDAMNETKAEGGTDEHPVQIAPGESLGFNWSVRLPAHLLNCTQPRPITVADISMKFKTIRKTAFAVYSEDDHSLDFYKRIRIPQAGETLNGKTVTNIYTGFETTKYRCIKTGEYDAEYTDGAIIDTPWYDRRYNIESVEVVDDGIRPEYLDYWFMNFGHCKTLKLNRLDTSQCQTAIRVFNRCRMATDIEASKWDTANMLTLSEAFLECNAIETLDISGWVCPRNTSLHSTWNNCNKLREIRFNKNWMTQNVRYFSCTFYATAFEKLDLSSWKFDKVENASVMLGYMKELREINISSFISKAGLISSETSVDKSIFADTTNISKITVGDGLKWNDIRDTQNETTPSPVSPSGKWYSTTSGKAYNPADLPDRTADTYVSDTALLPMKAFAIYSDTDKSLNLYKRHINEIPSVSDMYNERVVTRIYFNFEDSNPICNENPDAAKYKRGYFHAVEEYVTNINIIDTGIKPINISGWFSCFSELTSVMGMQNLDLSRCVGMVYTFFHDQKLETINLSNLTCPNVMSIGGIFEQCTGLRNADMTNLYIPKANGLWFVFFHTKIPSIDLSTWTVGQVTSMKSCFASNSELKEIKLPIGFSFSTVHDAWSMFYNCPSLMLDCSSWDFPPDAIHDDFNSESPGVIPPTVWDDIK